MHVVRCIRVFTPGIDGSVSEPTYLANRNVMMSIAVRPASRDDFAEWLRLRDSVYTGLDDDFHRQEMQRILADDGMVCLLAVGPDGQVCGMVEVSLRNVVDGCLTSSVGYVEGIIVDAEYRGSGVSRQLLTHAEQWCRSRGCEEIATDAELKNVEAQTFHRHMGFQETYRIVQYRKRLSQSPS